MEHKGLQLWKRFDVTMELTILSIRKFTLTKIHHLEVGVPQGFILGPSLFIILKLYVTPEAYTV